MYTITVQGKEGLFVGFQKINDRFQDFRPTLEKLGDETFKIIRKRFDAEGPGWAPLSPAYAAEKARRFPGKPILRRQDDLYNSFVKGGRSNVNRVSKLEGEFGSSDFKAPLHQEGKGRLPARPILEITNQDEVRFTEIVVDDLKQEFEVLGFTVT